MAINLEGVLNLQLKNLAQIEQSLNATFSNVNSKFVSQFANEFTGVGKISNFINELNKLQQAGADVSSGLATANKAISVLGTFGGSNATSSVGSLATTLASLKSAFQDLAKNGNTEAAQTSIKNLIVTMRDLGVSIDDIAAIQDKFKLDVVGEVLKEHQDALKKDAKELETYVNNYRKAQQQLNKEDEERAAIVNRFRKAREQIINKATVAQTAQTQGNLVAKNFNTRQQTGQGILTQLEQDAASNNKILDLQKRLTAQRIIAQNRSIAAERASLIGGIENRGKTPDGNRGIVLGIQEKEIEAAKRAADAIAKAKQEQDKLNSSLERGKITAFSFGQAVGLAFKRFSAFVLGSSPIFLLVGAIHNATKEALAFEHQITKIEQVLDIAPKQVETIAESIRNAASRTGSPINQIAEGVQTFAQAGFKDPDQLKKVANELAKIPLTATFGDIKSTVEGTIAVFGQFNLGLKDTAEIFDTVNQFAADFAVESKDIFQAVKLGGSAFATAGGSFKEFVSLFSLLRSATREQPAALGNFIKIAVNRLSTPKDQAILKRSGVTSTDIISQLTEFAPIFGQLNGNEQIKIANDLLGSRQSNRLVTILKQLNEPGNADRLKKALANSTGSVDQSIVKRLDDVGVSFDRIKESFNAFVTSISQDERLKQFIKQIADLTSQLLSLAKVITPVIPLLITLAGISAASKVGQVFEGFKSKFNIFNSARGTNLRSAAIVEDTVFNRTNNRVLAGSAATLREQRLSRVQSGRFLQRTLPRIGIGAALAGDLIAEKVVQNNPASIAGNVTAGAINGGLLGGFSFGPVGAVVGTLIGSFKGLDNALNSSRDAIFEELKAREASVEERVKAIKENPVPTTTKAIGGIETFFNDIIGYFGGTGNKVSDFKNRRITNDISINQQDATRLGLFNDKETTNLVTDILRKSTSKAEDDLRSQIRVNPEQFKNQPSFDLLLNKNAAKNALSDIQKVIPGANVNDISILIANLRQRGKLNETDNQKYKDLVNNSITEKNNLQDIQPFEDRADKLASLFTQFTDKLTDVFETLNRKSDALGKVITNSTALTKLSVPTNPIEALQFGGFTGLAKFKEESRDIAKQLSDVLSDTTNLNAARFQGRQIRDVGDTTKTSRAKPNIELIRDIAPALNEEQTQSLLKTFQQLSSETNKEFGDVIDSFAKFTGKMTDFVDQTRGGTEDINSALEITKQRIAIINQEREITRALNDQIRSLNQQLISTQKHVEDLGDSELERFRSQQEFLNKNAGTSTALTARGVDFANQTSGSNFGDIKTFINETLALSKANNTSLTTASKSNNLFDIQTADINQEKFANAQQELGQRLSELDDKIKSAANATDTLRQAFLKLDDSVVNAGRGASQLTVRDFAFGIQSLNQYQSGGLNNLLPKQFDALQKLLSTAGDFDFGKGITGNKILEDINRQLGIPFLAAIQRQLPGNQNLTQAQAESNIKKQLDDAKSKAEKANDVENDLRTKQLTLVDLQTKLIEDQKQFYSGQKKLTDILGKLPDNNQVLNSIDQKVGALYNIVNSTFGNGKNGNSIASTVDIKPIQVNVALNAPDVVNTVAPVVYNKVMQQIGQKIGDALGVIDKEAQNKFLGSITT